MPAHPEFTTRFAAALKGAPLPPGVSGPEAEARFAVYRNNVAVGLINALATRFAVIVRLLGDEYFCALARVYAEAHRPQTPVLLGWGDTFAGFLEQFEPLAGYPYLGDVARIEYARGQAFHAADTVAVDPARLAGADPARLRLGLHPSVQVLRLAHPAVTIWAMNQPGAEARAVAPGPEIALILRDAGHEVPVTAITAADAAMIEALAAGSSLLAAAEAANWHDPGHDPNPILLTLMRAGALTEPETP